MGLIANASICASGKERYIEAIKELFPRGKFFDEQFENSESDLSKIVATKGELLYEFKQKMQALWNEARLETCSNETIRDYERTITKVIRDDLTLEERKSILKQYQYGKLDLSMLNAIAKIYNSQIVNIEYPNKPSVFGLSRFGRTRIVNYKAFNIMYVHAILGENTDKEKFEETITKLIFADKIVYFKYKN